MTPGHAVSILFALAGWSVVGLLLWALLFAPVDRYSQEIPVEVAQ